MNIRKRFLSIGAVVGALALGVSLAGAQAPIFFRIGTGGTAGTYYPIGGLIANAISGAGDKGVTGLVSTAVASNGSVANINAIQGGSMESGFTQSDVAFWAHSGTGLYEGKGKVEDLRLIATLYPETIHLVARKDAGIKSVADLKGKRV
ncbi:TAXI family TRAP transporter solute-binding subunit, partial [Agrobacterium sp. ST15.13.013]